MTDSTESLPLDQTSALLRLYLEWPENRRMEISQEANEFYLWMQEQLDTNFANLVNNLDEIKLFIKPHHKVLANAQYIKSRLSEMTSNVRTDNRIDIHTQVFYMIYDCQETPSLEGTIQRGLLLDIAPHGLRFETKVPLPPRTVLSMTVAQVNWDVRLYHLTGEVRWKVDQEDRHHVGVSIFKLDDYDGWQDFYELTTL